MTDAQNIRQLTALRFFAAAWVVLFHYWPHLQGAAALEVVNKGYLGVELFFTLSGFILCHVYRTAVEEQRFSYGAFLWARLARVYPLHLATLVGLGLVAGAATVAGFAVDPNILSWQALPANLLLLQAWGLAPVAGWNHPSWSISAEWFAYLTFPVFAWTVLRFKDRPRLTLVVAIAFLLGLNLAFEAATGKLLTLATIEWGALRIVPCFAYGCALHALWRGTPGSGRASAAAGALISGALVLAFAARGVHDSVIVVAMGGVILFLARMAESGSKAFGNHTLVYLGEISYSIYMVCVPWQIVFVNAATRLLKLNSDELPLPLWIVFSIGVIPLAAGSYHLIEKPARARMKVWADSWKVRRPTVAGA
jgi:peptidoglycan/LPS O-acetylase OafA/YrhL